MTSPPGQPDASRSGVVRVEALVASARPNCSGCCRRSGSPPAGAGLQEDRRRTGRCASPLPVGAPSEQTPVFLGDHGVSNTLSPTALVVGDKGRLGRPGGTGRCEGLSQPCRRNASGSYQVENVGASPVGNGNAVGASAGMHCNQARCGYFDLAAWAKPVPRRVQLLGARSTDTVRSRAQSRRLVPLYWRQNLRFPGAAGDLSGGNPSNRWQDYPGSLAGLAAISRAAATAGSWGEMASRGVLTDVIARWASQAGSPVAVAQAVQAGIGRPDRLGWP